MLANALKVLFPGIDFVTECQIQDDGNGPYLAIWNRPEPKPTQAEIEAAIPVAELSAYRATIQPVTAIQLRIALNQSGLRQAVESAVAAGPQDLKDWWEFSTLLHREHPLVVAMAAQLGIPTVQVDALWAMAAGIE